MSCDCLWKLNRWVGVDADFGGYHGKAGAVYWHSPSPVNYMQDFDVQTYLFGPRFSYRANKITPFVRVLFGKVVFDALPVENVSKSYFGLALGGGCDISIVRHLAVRVIQADYLKADYPGTFQSSPNNLKLSTGAVVRF